MRNSTIVYPLFFTSVGASKVVFFLITNFSINIFFWNKIKQNHNISEFFILFRQIILFDKNVTSTDLQRIKSRKKSMILTKGWKLCELWFVCFYQNLGHGYPNLIYGCHTCVEIAIYLVKTKISLLLCSILVLHDMVSRIFNQNFFPGVWQDYEKSSKLSKEKGKNSRKKK